MMLIAVILVSLFAGSFSQYPRVFVKPEYDNPYQNLGQNDATFQQRLPLPPGLPPGLPVGIDEEELTLPNSRYNYLPVYNTEYGFWNSQQQPKPAILDDTPEKKFQDVNKIINRLTAEMRRLSQESKQVRAEKKKDVHLIKRLKDDLKKAIKSTEVLQQDLKIHKKKVHDLVAESGFKNAPPILDKMLVEQFNDMIDRLEVLVENLSERHLTEKQHIAHALHAVKI